MSSSIVVEILLAVLAMVVGLGSFVGANRAGKAQTAVTIADIDAQAYERAKGIYESAIDTLEKQLIRLRDQLTELDNEVMKLQESNRRMSMQVTDLRLANERLERQLGINGEGHTHE